MPYQIPNGIQQYLLQLYSRFDKEPDSIPVLRIDDPDKTDPTGYMVGGHLRLEDFKLTLVPGTNSHAKTVEIDLTQPSSSKLPYLYQGTTIIPTITIEEVFNIINANGYLTSKVEPRFFNVAATILAEMDEPYDGRSFLSAATSVLWRILMPIALEGKNERNQATQAVRQFDLRIAEGKWLDRIGNLYGLQRYENEEDERFRRRIDFHVIRPHTNNASLEFLIERLFDFSSTVTDGTQAEWFITDDMESLTYVKGMRNAKRTPPGKIPFFSVYVEGGYTDEIESPDDKLHREMGMNQWFVTDDVNSTTASFGQDEKARTTPPGTKYYKTILENPEMLLIPTEEERSVYRSVLQYKAAGSHFILNHAKNVEANDDNDNEPFTTFVTKTTLLDDYGQRTTVIQSDPAPSRQLFFSDTRGTSPSANFPTRTTLSYIINVSGQEESLTRILSNS